MSIVHNDFLHMMDDLLELEQGTLTGAEKLKDIENWDSLSIVSFMALAKAQYNANVPAKGIADAETVDDLFALIESQAVV